MPTVELVYDSDCPNVADARAQLLRAFAEAKLLPRWQEWQGDAADSHPHVRGYGSPTILVDGVDVAETEERGGPCCRLYAQPDGSMRGVPSVETLAAALKASANAGPIATSGGENWKLNFAMLPGIGAAFLPKVACPACLPAYAGFLSSIGLGFLVETTYLLPLTGLFLAVAVFALAFRARRRRGHGPFILGAAASAIVLIGKFSFESNLAMYAGLALLVAASLWNSWPRSRPAAACPSCVGDGRSTTQPVR
jgi:hypothetical protein